MPLIDQLATWNIAICSNISIFVRSYECMAQMCIQFEVDVCLRAVNVANEDFTCLRVLSGLILSEA